MSCPAPDRPRRLRGAFTLIELVVVVALLGVLAALAVPAFQAVVERSRTSAAEASLEAVGREAQALAAFDQTDVTAAHVSAAIADTGQASTILTTPAGLDPDGGDGDAQLEAGEWLTSATTTARYVTAVVATLPDHVVLVRIPHGATSPDAVALAAEEADLDADAELGAGDARAADAAGMFGDTVPPGPLTPEPGETTTEPTPTPEPITWTTAVTDTFDDTDMTTSSSGATAVYDAGFADHWTTSNGLLMLDEASITADTDWNWDWLGQFYGYQAPGAAAADLVRVTADIVAPAAGPWAAGPALWADTTPASHYSDDVLVAMLDQGHDNLWKAERAYDGSMYDQRGVAPVPVGPLATDGTTSYRVEVLYSNTDRTIVITLDGVTVVSDTVADFGGGNPADSEVFGITTQLFNYDQQQDYLDTSTWVPQEPVGIDTIIVELGTDNT